MRCPNCRVVVPQQTSVCPKCSSRLRGVPDAPPEQESRDWKPSRTAARTTSRTAGRVSERRRRPSAPLRGSDALAASAFELELERAFDPGRGEARATLRAPIDGDIGVDDALEAQRDAERERQRIIEDAEAEARRIVARAETDAANMRASVDSD